MTYRTFEELPVWQSAASLYEGVEELLSDEHFPTSSGFRSQLDRAALSVSNNIAEGFERGTTNELLAFIYIARGSAGETRSMLRLSAGSWPMSHSAKEWMPWWRRRNPARGSSAAGLNR